MHIKLQLTSATSVNLLCVCCESAVFLGTNTVNLQKQERLGNQMGQLVNYRHQNWSLCLMTTHGVWEILLLERQASKSGTQVHLQGSAYKLNCFLPSPPLHALHVNNSIHCMPISIP